MRRYLLVRDAGAAQFDFVVVETAKCPAGTGLLRGMPAAVCGLESADLEVDRL